MLSIVLLGTGNLAQQLFDNIYSLQTVKIVQVYGRGQKGLSYFENKCATTQEPKAIVEADLYILAVSDSAIRSVSQLLIQKNGIVVHTSGSIPMNAIPLARRGVFYPLQTFTKGRSLDFGEIPICLEVAVSEDGKILKALADQLSKKVVWIPSEQRKKLHLTAVIVNNFSNHCYHIAKELCDDEDIAFELLHPLIKETAAKAIYMSPEDAQTGPARRNDILTQQEHLEALEHPLHKKIYQLLTESIKQHYEKKL